MALPLVALLGYNLWREASHARRAAYQAVESHAAGIAHDTDALLTGTAQYLDFLAIRPQVVALDPVCDPVLDDVVRRRRHFADVVLVDLAGRLVCSAVAGPGGPGGLAEGYADHAWFQQAMRQDQPALGKPFLASIVRRTVVAVSRPVMAPGRGRIGTVAALLDLESLQADWQAYRLLPNTRLAIVDETARIVVIRPGFARWVGADAGPALRAALTDNPAGVGVATGIDGVARAFARMPVGSTGWYALASVPAVQAFADYHAGLLRSLVLTGALMLVVLGVAVVLARRLAAPLNALAATARAVAGGDDSVRADEALPGEYGDVARETNAMLESRQRTEAKLLHRERQLAGLVDTAMDAIVSIDAQHKIRLFNRAAAEMFRLPAEQAIGEDLDRFIPTRVREAHRQHVRMFARTGSTARRMGLLQTLTGLRADGEEFPVEASISKLGDAGHMLMTVVIRDATELRRAERARLAQAAAESASRAKTDFLSRMSHELRTPLNAILGFSQLLQARTIDPLSDAQRQQVEHIRLAGWHLLALINDVLDVSRIEAGRLTLSPRAVDLLAALDEALRISEATAAQQRMRVEADYRDSGGLWVTADPVRLRQVLLNLLSNAIKYNRPEGSVHLQAKRAAQQVHVSIEDTGLGMTAEQLAHLYEPFNRLGREHHGIEGTGLGLALTRQLMELMHARIDVESTAGEGTRVTITLAAAEEPTAAAGAASPAPSVPQLPTDAEPNGSVLYIEDNP
ncbi:ATP-binding protein [Aquincola sp. MAHUQ-54]|uniref:histidine kinase n=1 Tax=Aquincola agrisoli TaxID=3119538 RepID=A0AAW9PXZ2_9BURK